MKENHFTGTSKLLRLYLRRDRVILPVWVLLSLMVINGQVSFVKAMPDWQVYIVELSDSPLVSGLLGPVVPLSLEGAILWRGMLQASITVMLGAALTMIRHTRTEETTNRNELILGRPVGRYANLSAAFLLSCGGSLIAGLLVIVLLVGLGFEWNGSIVTGLTLVASGCCFAGIGGLCAQVFAHSSSARGAVFGVYGLTMVTMSTNNIGGGDTLWVWLTPEAWFRVTVPFEDNNYWPILIFIIISAFPLILSYKMLECRNMGSGLIEQKEGSEEAPISFNSPLAMAWRQHKVSILIWSLGMAWIGGMVGIATPNIYNAISSTLSNLNAWGAAIEKLGNQEAFMALLIYILGLMGGLSVFAITIIQGMRQEEKEHYAEMILSRSVSRIKWMASYLTVAFIGSAIILLTLGLSSGIGWSITSGDLSHIFRVLGMSLSKIPSVWLIIGIAALLYGWIPKIGYILNWVILGIFIFIEMLWEVGLVEWSALQMTPFAYAHYSIPINELPIMPLIALIGLTIALTYLGIIGFKRRSIY